MKGSIPWSIKDIRRARLGGSGLLLVLSAKRLMALFPKQSSVSDIVQVFKKRCMTENESSKHAVRSGFVARDGFSTGRVQRQIRYSATS